MNYPAMSVIVPLDLLRVLSAAPVAKVPNNFALALQKNFSHRNHEGDFAILLVQAIQPQSKNNQTDLFLRDLPLGMVFFTAYSQEFC